MIDEKYDRINKIAEFIDGLQEQLVKDETSWIWVDIEKAVLYQLDYMEIDNILRRLEEEAPLFWDGTIHRLWFIHAANRVIDYAYFHADLDDIDMILTSLTNTTMEILTRSLREAPEDVLSEYEVCIE